MARKSPKIPAGYDKENTLLAKFFGYLNNGSMSDLSEESGIPQSTLRSMYKGGTAKNYAKTKDRMATFVGDSQLAKDRYQSKILGSKKRPTRVSKGINIRDPLVDDFFSYLKTKSMRQLSDESVISETALYKLYMGISLRPYKKTRIKMEAFLEDINDAMGMTVPPKLREWLGPDIIPVGHPDGVNLYADSPGSRFAQLKKASKIQAGTYAIYMIKQSDVILYTGKLILPAIVKHFNDWWVIKEEGMPTPPKFHNIFVGFVVRSMRIGIAKKKKKGG